MTLSLTSIDAWEAQIETAAACVAENVALFIFGRETSLTLLPDHIPLNRPEVTLPLLIDGHTIVVRFDQLPVPGDILEKMGVISFANLPETLRKMVVEKAISPDLDRFEDWSNYKISFAETPVSLSQLPICIPFNLSGILGDISAPAEAASLLSGLLTRLPEKKFPGSRIPLSLGIEVGRTLLEVEEIRKLKTGDVILIEKGPDLKNDQIEIRPSHDTVYRGILRGSEIKIESYMNVNTDYISEFDNASEAGTGNLPAKRDSVTSIGAVPVTAVFELGRRQVTIDDLDQLQPGVVLELEHPVEEAEIIVRVNGKAIATGQLAEVNGKIAVRIN
ncbi:MAG: type III secretion system cytoplasmic ring protein SctQ [Verrucomicrobiales bacterium]|nr:type III secretion system cytoplasmic ring protein SctQ [Verrucomicrobiales bacterium]